MSSDKHEGVAVIEQQLKELDKIFRETITSLNTVAGMEQVATWRKQTVALLSQSVGPQAAQEFARIQPGPSFTNDLVDEFTDFVDTFKVPLSALARKLSNPGHAPSGGG